MLVEIIHGYLVTLYVLISVKVRRVFVQIKRLLSLLQPEVVRRIAFNNCVAACAYQFHSRYTLVWQRQPPCASIGSGDLHMARLCELQHQSNRSIFKIDIFACDVLY